jgi:uncharacterized protein (TIGR00725 family)
MARMISVIGGENASPEAVRLAEEVGRELARRGAVVVCGGGSGVMEGVCRGARQAGGHTIGILPGHNAQESPPNPWVEFPIYTGLGYARNSMVVLSGEAVIAIDGAYGTLSEIAYALIYGIPIVGLDTWEFRYGMHNPTGIVRVQDPREAVELALRLAEERRASQGGGS